MKLDTRMGVDQAEAEGRHQAASRLCRYVTYSERCNTKFPRQDRAQLFVIKNLPTLLKPHTIP